MDLRRDDARLKELLEPSAVALTVEIAVHDASRFEWRVALPLPADKPLAYTIEAGFELPSTALSGRSPWDQLQGFTRLEGPQLLNGTETAPDVNVVRQRVLALQHLLRRAREGVVRHCGQLAVPGRQVTKDDSRFLVTWIETAFSALAAARADLAQDRTGESGKLKRERELADEFVSVRLVDFVAEAQASADSLRPGANGSKRLNALLASVDDRLGKALEGELSYRREKGYPVANMASPESLERYVERAGRLKRHFESALSLDRESFPVEERINVWLTVIAAIVAGAFAFAAQLYVLNSSNTTTLSWSLLGVTILMGGTYAMREKTKDVFRRWVTGRVHRSYAQRVLRCFLHGDAQRSVVLQAREWCHERTKTLPDPLNPESGSSMRVTEVEHIHNGEIAAQPALVQAGIQRVRQIIRYDLSPMFPRLQDAVKLIPIIDPETGRPRFVGAPRRYQMPVRVRAVCRGEEREATATIILDKQGLVRIDAGPAGQARSALND